MITRLELKNFTAFDELVIDFSPKINVIIGANGTGKTHLLKCVHLLCKADSLLQDQTKASARRAMTDKLLRLFQPLNDDLGGLWRRGSQGSAQMTAHFALGEQETVTFSQNSKQVRLEEQTHHTTSSQLPVFIPTKEVLSFIQGIQHSDADRATLLRIFDDTYLDLCDQLVAAPTENKGDRIDFDPRFGTILPDMVNAIGGRYEFREGRFYFHRGTYVERPAKDRPTGSDRIETLFEVEKNSNTSNAMTAEGFRKIGILQQLLVNASLNPGISGALLWDEPEANINPKLMRLLVESLLELARNGQQIILATHDYFLLKWFDLLLNEGKGDHIRFHALYHENESTGVRLDSTDDYRAISPNSIAQTFDQLTDHEIERVMGGLGK